jgi:hypothetical protein
MMFRCRLSLAGRRITYFTVPFFRPLVELRLGKGGVAAEGHLFALRLLPLDLGQQQFLPVVGAVDFARTQFGGQAVALAVEATFNELLNDS